MFLWETTAAAVVLWRSELIQAYIVKRVKQWRQNMRRCNTAAAQDEGRNDNLEDRTELDNEDGIDERAVNKRGIKKAKNRRKRKNNQRRVRIHIEQEKSNLGNLKQKKQNVKRSKKLKPIRNTPKINKHTTIPVENIIVIKSVKQNDTNGAKSGQSLKDAPKTNSVKRKDKPSLRQTQILDTIFEDTSEQMNEINNKTDVNVNTQESENKREYSYERNAGCLKINTNYSSLPDVEI